MGEPFLWTHANPRQECLDRFTQVFDTGGGAWGAGDSRWNAPSGNWGTARLSPHFPQMYAQTLAADHQLVGIAHVRLGGALLLNERYSDAVAESHSGYEILMKQASPPANWLQKARTDLVEEYDALKQPEQAAKYRAELTAEKDTAISKKN